MFREFYLIQLRDTSRRIVAELDKPPEGVFHSSKRILGRDCFKISDCATVGK